MKILFNQNVLIKATVIRWRITSNKIIVIKKHILGVGMKITIKRNKTDNKIIL